MSLVSHKTKSNPSQAIVFIVLLLMSFLQTIEDAHKLSKDMGMAFPHVEFPEEDREEPKDIYVFPGDDNTPTVIHMPLFNRVNCHGNRSLCAVHEHTS